MHTLNVIIRGAVFFGLLAVGLRAWAQEKPFVGKLKTETAPDEKPASSRTVRPQESPSAAESDESESLKKPLADVVVEGNQTISTEEILKLVKMRPGMPFDPKQVKADVRAAHFKALVLRRRNPDCRFRERSGAGFSSPRTSETGTDAGRETSVGKNHFHWKQKIHRGIAR